MNRADSERMFQHDVRILAIKLGVLPHDPITTDAQEAVRSTWQMLLDKVFADALALGVWKEKHA